MALLLVATGTDGAPLLGAGAAFGRRDECYLVTGTVLSHENSFVKGLL